MAINEQLLLVTLMLLMAINRHQWELGTINSY